MGQSVGKSGHMSGKTKQPKHKMSAMAKKEERTAWLFIALPFLGFYFLWLIRSALQCLQV